MSKRTARRLLIDIATRHQRPGSGSSDAFLKARTARLEVPDLTQILEGIPWTAVGAIAARAYMPERATGDFDIAILPQHGEEVGRRLESAGFQRTGLLTIGGSSWLSPEGFSLDVIELSQPWAETALQQAQQNVRPAGIPALTLPYLVLMKFEAGRVVDLGDISRMLGQASEDDLEGTRRLFRRYAAEDMEDLESLITLGRLEMQG